MELSSGLSQLDQFGSRVQERFETTTNAIGETVNARYETSLHALDGSGWGPPHRSPAEDGAAAANQRTKAELAAFKQMRAAYPLVDQAGAARSSASAGELSYPCDRADSPGAPCNRETERRLADGTNYGS